MLQLFAETWAWPRPYYWNEGPGPLRSDHSVSLICSDFVEFHPLYQIGIIWQKETGKMIHWKNTKSSPSARSHIIKVITTKMRSQTSAEFLGSQEGSTYSLLLWHRLLGQLCHVLLGWLFTSNQWRPQTLLLICILITETMSFSYSTNGASQQITNKPSS